MTFKGENVDDICIYLRKSRADEEIEKTLGEGETLLKHRKALLKFASEKHLNIVEIKEEIISGDSLFFRPKMLELLKEVEGNKYSGVLVMDIDRLGRGGMKDQGIILDAFKESNTKIITPMKTYDLNNEMDEEMTEFKTFFSRRELKTINRRMQGGRIRSAEDGNYIATNPPLGYDITFIKKSRTLKINESESEIIKMIFNMYAEGNGAGTIAKYLNSLGYKTKSNGSFNSSSILFILKNPVYIGKITWKKKKIKKSKEPDKLTSTKTRDKSEWIISNGKHQPIIDEILYYKVQDILKCKYHIPYQLTNAPVNPLAGLVKCKVCGKKMTMRSLRGVKRLLCTNSSCSNKSVRFDYFERTLINTLKEYLKNYKIQLDSIKKKDNTEIYVNQLNLLNKELKTLKKQKNKLYDLLERQIYTEEIFLERSNNIDKRIDNINKSIDDINKIIDKNNNKVTKQDISNFENILLAYDGCTDVKSKNELMRTILYEVQYLKLPEQKNGDFNIEISPKLLR